MKTANTRTETLDWLKPESWWCLKRHIDANPSENCAWVDEASCSPVSHIAFKTPSLRVTGDSGSFEFHVLLALHLQLTLHFPSASPSVSRLVLLCVGGQTQVWFSWWSMPPLFWMSHMSAALEDLSSITHLLSHHCSLSCLPRWLCIAREKEY